MSLKENSSTARQRPGSKISETIAPSWQARRPRGLAGAAPSWRAARAFADFGHMPGRDRFALSGFADRNVSKVGYAARASEGAPYASPGDRHRGGIRRDWHGDRAQAGGHR